MVLHSFLLSRAAAALVLVRLEYTSQYHTLANDRSIIIDITSVKSFFMVLLGLVPKYVLSNRFLTRVVQLCFAAY